MWNSYVFQNASTMEIQGAQNLELPVIDEVHDSALREGVDRSWRELAQGELARGRGRM